MSRTFTSLLPVFSFVFFVSFGSALHRNCRINRFTVGDQVFELPERYTFERDLGKGAYGFVCSCKVSSHE